MKRFALSFVFVVTLSLAAAPVTDTESLLRDGNAAFRRGDYARAAELYERAGLRTTEPALIAFNLAATKYRHALESADDRAKHLEEAAQYFRCCLDTDDPRRLRAQHYLGACLLQQALDGDGSRAQEAIELFEACLKNPGLDAATAEDARHNLALARLVFAQTPPPPPNQSRPEDKPSGEDNQPAKQQPKERRGMSERGMDPNGEPTRGNSDRRTKSGDVNRDIPRTGDGAQDTQSGRDQTHRGPDGQAIDPADARYLTDAFERIYEERQSYNRKKALPPAPGVKDW